MTTSETKQFDLPYFPIRRNCRLIRGETNLYETSSVKTNVPEPYKVEWRVTNTGEEAIADDARRGDFYESEDFGKRVRWKSTAYRGTHWVKAFILNSDGICVAQTAKKLVKPRFVS